MFIDAINQWPNYAVSVIQLDSVQNFLSATLLSKNTDIKVHRTVIFPVV